ncbi:MAG: hypothetical protein JW990_03405 [Thermoleophilia bacterium]|nr:hypothetical protein [Thermoleophilia bacterium]
MAEILDEVAEAESLNGFPADADQPSAPLTQADRLLLHFFIFVIGSWNLVMIDLAHSPEDFWCRLPIASWASVLVLHLGILLLLRRRSSGIGIAPLPSGQESRMEGMGHV